MKALPKSQRKHQEEEHSKYNFNDFAQPSAHYPNAHHPKKKVHTETSPKTNQRKKNPVAPSTTPNLTAPNPTTITYQTTNNTKTNLITVTTNSIPPNTTTEGDEEEVGEDKEEVKVGDMYPS